MDEFSISINLVYSDFLYNFVFDVFYVLPCSVCVYIFIIIHQCSFEVVGRFVRPWFAVYTFLSWAHNSSLCLRLFCRCCCRFQESTSMLRLLPLLIFAVVMMLSNLLTEDPLYSLQNNS